LEYQSRWTTFHERYQCLVCITLSIVARRPP
jgi:hypothetical protein